MVSRIWSALIVFLLAGCAHPPEHNPHTIDNSTLPSESASISTSEEPRPSQVPQHALEFQLTGCHGVISKFAWPGPEGPGTAPPGWNDTFPTGGFGSNEYVELLDCNRVSWGSFERPIRFYIESHDKADVPPNCPTSNTLILQSIWTDDEEFNAFLVREYKIPTRLAEFQISFDNTTEPMSTTWVWGPHGSKQSELTVYMAQGPSQSPPLNSDVRFVWDNGSGVTYSWFNETLVLPKDVNQASNGTLRAPTLHASTGIEQWTGTANTILGDEVAGKLTEYRNYSCDA